MNPMQCRSFLKLLVPGVCSLLVACSTTTTQVSSSNPSISLHPTPVSNQLVVSLGIAYLKQSPKAIISSDANSTSTDQVFQNPPAYKSASTQPPSKSQQALDSAALHAIVTLRPQVEKTLSQYGFVPVPYQSKLQRKLVLQIDSLQPSGGLLSTGLQATVEADAINGMLTYSRTYTGTVSGFSITGLKSESASLLGNLFNQALGDQQLINFLNQ